jgi:hypothetical protein
MVFLWLAYSKFFGSGYVSVTDLILLPVLAALLVMTLVYVLHRWTVPVTWHKVSAACSQHLRETLRVSAETALQGLPQNQATLLADERAAVETILGQIALVDQRVQAQEQLGHVAVLYSK